MESQEARGHQGEGCESLVVAAQQLGQMSKTLKKLMTLNPSKTLEDIMKEPRLNMGQKEELGPHRCPQVAEKMKNLSWMRPRNQ